MKTNSLMKNQKIKNQINSYLGMLRDIDGYNLRKNISLEIANLFIRPDKEYPDYG